ncbi:MAG: ADP-ribosylation factor-like protein [Candidatus Hodarchaeota archaeon]
MSQSSDNPEKSQTSHFGEKMIFVGLSEAGKTAIRDLCFGGKDTEEVEGLGATINYVRQIVTMNSGRMFTIMDLGGQRIFLERFMNQFSPFVFHRVKTLIYVVDVADNTRYRDAKEYFKNALARLKERSPSAESFILLHKMDLLDETIKQKTIEYLQNLFQREVESPLIFFETSIYDDSIKKAIDEIVRHSFPEISVTSEALEKEYITSPEVEAPQIEVASDTTSTEVLQPSSAPFETPYDLNVNELARAIGRVEEFTGTTTNLESQPAEERIISSPSKYSVSVASEEVTDSFKAAEMLIEYLESLIITLDISYIALFEENEEPLFEIGDRVQYLEIIQEINDAFNSKSITHSDSNDLRIVETEKLLLVAQPLQSSQILMLAGAKSIKPQLLENMSELRTKISDMVCKVLETSI